MPTPPLRLSLAGQEVELHGDRALYWPARSRLLIADLHLGKGDAFRVAGIALPTGGTSSDLERLSALILRTRARALWILGDVLHGRLVDASWRATWEGWRSRHREIELAVLAGNHDRALRSAGMDLSMLGEVARDGPFTFRHHPVESAGDHVLCGHLHPVAAIAGIGRRWPAFWLRTGSTVLPAFSALTGGMLARPGPGERLVACVEGAAITAPTSVAR